MQNAYKMSKNAKNGNFLLQAFRDIQHVAVALCNKWFIFVLNASYAQSMQHQRGGMSSH